MSIARPNADPLGPENPLIFACSPLVGSRLTTSSKFAVAAKSPLTGMIGDSLSSSFLAVELKRAGCDALVVKGRSDRKTLLSIERRRSGIPRRFRPRRAGRLRNRARRQKPARQAFQGRLHRPSWRKRRPLRQHRQRRRQAGGTHRNRRRHGFQEPQGDSRSWTQSRARVRQGQPGARRARPLR